jgi:aryl-alcohol dehydrogenase-like predicted oxidoreductase
VLTGKYFDSQHLDNEDRRYERFTNPRARAALAKLAELRFLTDQGRTMVQAALRFVLDTPGVTSAIPGAKDRAQLEQNVGAEKVPPLSLDERKRAMDIGSESGWPPPSYAKKA